MLRPVNETFLLSAVAGTSSSRTLECIGNTDTTLDEGIASDVVGAVETSANEDEVFDC